VFVFILLLQFISKVKTYILAMTMEPKYKDKKCTCENASDRLRFEVVGKE